MDVAADSVAATIPPGRPAWRLDWLTPVVCRCLLAVVLIAGFLAHLHYLHNNCPIGLSGDEAQYWDWSRQLDLSYYSKGPLVAYIIRASCAVFGDTMPAVRYPALVLGVFTSIVTYLLARKLFRSERVALGAVLLYHLVPMFVAGSVLMTIDPPFFLCWGLATYLLAIAVFDDRRWPWVAIGVVLGVGFLAKYAMFLWLVPMLLALLADRQARAILRTRWPWVAIGVALLFTIPVIVWNARHDWVSLAHVSTQTGTGKSAKFSPGNVLEFLGGQVGAIGPTMFVILVGAVIHAARLSRRKRAETPDDSTTSDHMRECRFLAVLGVGFFAIILFDTLLTKVQMNWAAPAYFTLIILAAHFLGTRLADRKLWKPWRPWFWCTVGFGAIMMPIAHDPGLLYPALNRLRPKVEALRADWLDKPGFRHSVVKKIPEDALTARKFDFAAKLKGWDEFGQVVSDRLPALGTDAFVMCHDYQQAAQMAFYVRGQPKTYYAASYYQDSPGRMTQYDVWPDRDLGPTSRLIGRNAVYVGNVYKPTPDLLSAFDRVVGPVVIRRRELWFLTLTVPDVWAFTHDVVEDGTNVRTFRYFLCYGFKGMKGRTTEKR